MTRQILLFPPLRDERGTTLVEVLVALAIASGVLLALSQGITGRFGRDALSEGVATVREAGQEAHRLARSRQETVSLVFRGQEIVLADAAGAALPSAGKRQFSAAVAVRVIGARELRSNNSPVILFLPDGRSSGGQVEFSSGRSTMRVVIDDQTARVTGFR